MNKTVIGYVPGSGGVKLRVLLHWQPQWLQSSGLCAQYDPLAPVDLNSQQNLQSDKQTVIKNNLKEVSHSHDLVDHKSHQLPPLFPIVHGDKLFDANGLVIEPFYDSNDIVMSHSMSYQALKLQFPDRKIVKIKCDPMQALRRWWVVFARNQNMSMHRISSKFDDAVSEISNPTHKLIAHLIIMHLEYYQNHYDLEADVLIDINKGPGEFCHFMKQDLDICKDPDFDLVSTLLKQHQSVQDILSNIASKNS